MNYLPPYDCLLLVVLPDLRSVWSHARYIPLPLPTWAHALTGETVDLEAVVTFAELPKDPEV